MWQDLVHHTPEWWSAVLGLIGIIYWAVLKPLGVIVHRAWKLAPVLSSADTTLQSINENIAIIKKEVAFNDGSSLKDAVVRIEVQAKTNNADSKAQTEGLTKQLRSVQALALSNQRRANRQSQRLFINTQDIQSLKEQREQKL